MSVVDRLTTALIDRYRLERELGQGGMATVYLAEDLKHGRKVAIKVLHPELSAVIGGDRFLAEIKVTANLQHPHILGLIDSGEADGLLYYVMPYVSGEIAPQPPAPRASSSRSTMPPALEGSGRARSTTPTARASSTATSSPRTSCCRTARPWWPTSASRWPCSRPAARRMTQTGMSLGTPAYMSPEQAMGEREIGARSDVYALGAMTYEMLAGEPPFTGLNSQAIVAKVLTEQPPLLRPKRPLVSPAVENAVLTALQKLPADRYGSREGLRRRPRRHRQGAPTRPRSLTPGHAPFAPFAPFAPCRSSPPPH